MRNYSKIIPHTQIFIVLCLTKIFHSPPEVFALLFSSAFVFLANSAYKEKSLKEFLLSLKQRYPTAHVFRPTEEEFIVVDYIHNSVKRIIRDAKGNEKIEDQKEISVKEK